MADCFTTLPRKLKAGSFTYRVILVNPDDKRLEVEEGAEAGYAVTDLIARKVYLDNSMSRETALTIVIHETQHIINNLLGIEDGATEEQFTTASGTGWFNIWMENPKLLRWVCRMTREIRKESKS